MEPKFEEINRMIEMYPNMGFRKLTVDSDTNMHRLAYNFKVLHEKFNELKTEVDMFKIYYENEMEMLKISMSNFY